MRKNNNTKVMSILISEALIISLSEQILSRIDPDEPYFLAPMFYPVCTYGSLQFTFTIKPMCVKRNGCYSNELKPIAVTITEGNSEVILSESQYRELLYEMYIQLN